MTAPSEVDIGTLIERRPGVNRGRPLLKGTGMSVHQIGVLLKEGLDAADIQQEYPHLDLARIHAGITYYLANQSWIDQELEEETREYERAAAQHPTDSPWAE